MSKHYYGVKNYCDDRIAIVTGACRSGKTILCRIAGSFRNVEWIEEPYSLIGLLQGYGVGMLTSGAGQSNVIINSLLPAIIHELIIDHVLLRNGNFRTSDLSSIWNYKSSQEIFFRLSQIVTRSEAYAYIEENNPLMIIDIPEVLPFLQELKSYYKRLKIIHVIRNGFDVASDVYEKDWFSDEGLRKQDGYFVREIEDDRIVPWWVPSNQEALFIEGSAYERAIMYWVNVIAYGVKDMADVQKRSDCIIRYEEMVENTKKVVGELKSAGILDKHESTSYTAQYLSELKPFFRRDKEERKTVRFKYIEDSGFARLMSYFGYKTEDEERYNVNII